jgi:hypothetical protein
MQAAESGKVGSRGPRAGRWEAKDHELGMAWGPRLRSWEAENRELGVGSRGPRHVMREISGAKVGRWEVGDGKRGEGKQKIESWGWEVKERELCDEKQEIELRMGSRGLGAGRWEAGKLRVGRCEAGER